MVAGRQPHRVEANRVRRRIGIDQVHDAALAVAAVIEPGESWWPNFCGSAPCQGRPKAVAKGDRDP
jgi:hypothetical protein